MKKFYLIILLFLLMGSTANAQYATRAIGVRGGISSGFEYRAFANDFLSYRVLLSSRHHGLQLTGLKEFHQQGAFDFSDELVFIYGFGAHLGFESWKAYDPDISTRYDWEYRASPVAGLDALAGVEYNFWDFPLTVGLEAKPFFNLFGKNFFQLQPFDIAFTIRYVF